MLWHIVISSMFLTATLATVSQALLLKERQESNARIEMVRQVEKQRHFTYKLDLLDMFETNPIEKDYYYDPRLKNDLDL